MHSAAVELGEFLEGSLLFEIIVNLVRDLGYLVKIENFVSFRVTGGGGVVLLELKRLEI